MVGYEPGDVLRLAILSGLIGFSVFCLSFSVAVWKKRNGMRFRSPSKVAMFMIICGGLGAFASWLAIELPERSGVVGGADVFVVRNQRELRLLSLDDNAVIASGQVIAELAPPGIDKQLAVVDSEINESKARLESLTNKPPVADAALMNQQQYLRVEMNQAKAFQFDLQKSKRQAEKDVAETYIGWIAQRNQIEVELESAKQSALTAQSQTGLAKVAVERAIDLRRREIISSQLAEDRYNTVLVRDLERSKSTVAVNSLSERLKALEPRYQAFGKMLDIHSDGIAADLTLIGERITELNGQLNAVDLQIIADRVRGVQSLAHDREAAEYQLQTLRFERERIYSATQIRAPFSGRIVYRHPSPGFAGEAAPILAISTGSGFDAQVWLPAGESDALIGAGKVQFTLDSGALNRYFLGSFNHSDQPNVEGGRVVAHFDAELPAEAIALISAGGSVKIHLGWRPSLTRDYAFLGSLVLMICGLLVVLLPGRLGGSGLKVRHPASDTSSNIVLGKLMNEVAGD